MSSVTPVLGVMLGLAVGIDYSLFIINRHRRQLFVGMELRDSIALANGTSGTAVVFAGSTVIIALLALNITGIPFLGSWAPSPPPACSSRCWSPLHSPPRCSGWSGRACSATVPGRGSGTPITPSHRLRTDVDLACDRSPLLVAVIALLVVAIPALSLRLGLPDGSI